MAISLPFKVFNPEGVLVTSAMTARLAAAAMAVLGEGASICHGRRSKDPVWIEGVHGTNAGFDTVAEHIQKVLDFRNRQGGGEPADNDTTPDPGTPF